ncbi:MAG: hypothetical protein ACOYMY_03105 [Prochlorococcaceae cyanobacterium]|jgi:hypothetical protein
MCTVSQQQTLSRALTLAGVDLWCRGRLERLEVEGRWRDGQALRSEFEGGSRHRGGTAWWPGRG